MLTRFSRWPRSGKWKMGRVCPSGSCTKTPNEMHEFLSADKQLIKVNIEVFTAYFGETSTWNLIKCKLLENIQLQIKYVQFQIK